MHDLYVWEITSGFPALSTHVIVGSDNDCHAARRRLEAVVHDQFDIGHTPLQPQPSPTFEQLGPAVDGLLVCSRAIARS